jgi:hypothetical protein
VKEGMNDGRALGSELGSRDGDILGIGLGSDDGLMLALGPRLGTDEGAELGL